MKDISEAIGDAEGVDAEIIIGLREAVQHSVIVGTQKARNEHGWQDRTGTTRESIQGRVRDKSAKGAVGTIIAGTNAARMNDGTAPHIIRPKMGARVEGPLKEGQSRRSRGRGRHVLAFTIGGRTVFAHEVHHPGTKADHFLDRAADAAGEALEQGVETAIDKALG